MFYSFSILIQAATTVLNQQQAPQTVTLHHGGIIGPYKDHTALRAEILKREPVEPARSPKQLFITDWLSKHKKKKLADAKEAWKVSLFGSIRMNSSVTLFYWPMPECS